MEMSINDLEELAEDSRGRDLKRWVEGGQTALDGRVQELWILSGHTENICIFAHTDAQYCVYVNITIHQIKVQTQVSSTRIWS